ncbi:MAG: head GIN domain-containing protein [Lautropia sp.]
MNATSAAARPDLRRRRFGGVIAAAAAAGVIAPVGPLQTGARAAPAVATKSIELAGYQRVVLAVPADVEIRMSGREGARITAEQKVIDAIRFAVSGGVLTVSPVRGFNTEQPVRIEIDCRQLAALTASTSVDAKIGAARGDHFELKVADSATVEFASLQASSLAVDIGGSGTVRIGGGQARSQQVHVGGSGTYEAGEVRSDTVKIDARGSSDAIVTAQHQLDATVGDAATVRYGGKPKVRRSVRDAGTLEPR